MKKISYFCSLLFILSSCMKDDLPKFNQLEKPRVLTLIANTPEVNPGAVVTVTPVISDLTATSLKDTVNSCLDSGISLGAQPTCENNPTKIVIHSNRTLSLPGSADQWTGLGDSFTVTVPSDSVIFNLKSDQDKYNGVSYLVEYILHGSDGKDIRTIKRIVVSESAKATKNLNPVVTQILSNTAPFSTLPLGTQVSLTTDVNAASQENFDLKNSEGTLKNYTEELTTTWFLTDGETQFIRSLFQEANLYTAPSAAPIGRSAYIISVTKDARGGVAVVRKKLN